MYRFRSTKYITTSALFAAFIVTIGYFSRYITVVPGLKGMIQFSDFLLLFNASFIPGPMAYYVAPISGFLIDLLGGALIYSPGTIIIHLILVIIVILGKKKLNIYLVLCIAIWSIMLYTPYQYLLDSISGLDINSKLINMRLEAISDVIQCTINLPFALLLYWRLNLLNKRSNYWIWNDRYFDQFNILKQIQGEEDGYKENS